MNFLQAAFASFRRNVIPPGAGARQVLEMEKAFYAGAFAFEATMVAIGDLPDEKQAEMAGFVGAELAAAPKRLDERQAALEGRN